MSDHQPGHWPVDEPLDLDAIEAADEQGAQHLAFTAGQARFHVTLGSIRADLEQQPSPMCVRAAARRWQDAITAMTDEVIGRLREAG
ncbi:hypothetical protein ABZX62_00120 [Streptomyces flavidovirens]|uniref:hypothetical protein n=1 Tax=Streptomyces flavidovirens TaxID=67298 RepID=UPI0033AE1070